MKRIYLAVMAVLGLLALAACGSSGSSANTGTTASSSVPSVSTSSSAATSASSSVPSSALPTAPGAVTIGSAGFTESELLADIYGDAMAAKGVKVTKHLDIGERPVYMAAMKDGSISAFPEYSGSILSYLAGKAATAKTPDDVYAALQPAAASQGFVVTKFSAAQDSDTITVTKETATKYKLQSIADLKDVAKNLTLGAPAQFRTRPDGVPALKSVYGVTFGRFTVTDAGGSVTVNSLKNGSIDAADIFSTDTSISQNGFVTLADPKSMFAAQNVTPIFSQKVLTQPMKDAVDAVSAKLNSTAMLRDLVAKANSTDPDKVAKQWLTQQGLI